MKTKINTYVVIPLSILMCFSADAEQLSVATSIASDNVDRGASLSHKSPVANFELSYDFSDIFYIGGALLYGKSKPSPILNRGGSAFAGLFFEVFDSQAVDLSFTRKYFVGDFIQDWDYDSFDITYHWNHQLSIDYSYSDDYYGRGFDSRYISVSWLLDISDNSNWIFSVGSLDYDRKGKLYRLNNVEAGIGFNLERWRLDIKYHSVSDGAKFIYQENSADSGVMMKLSYAIY